MGAYWPMAAGSVSVSRFLDFTERQRCWALHDSDGSYTQIKIIHIILLSTVGFFNLVNYPA